MKPFSIIPNLRKGISLLILILLTLFTDSCRKPVTERPGQGNMTAMSGSFLTVDMQEVWKKIPWTVMNNIGDQFSLDYSKKNLGNVAGAGQLCGKHTGSAQ